MFGSSMLHALSGHGLHSHAASRRVPGFPTCFDRPRVRTAVAIQEGLFGNVGAVELSPGFFLPLPDDEGLHNGDTWGGSNPFPDSLPYLQDLYEVDTSHYEEPVEQVVLPDTASNVPPTLEQVAESDLLPDEHSKVSMEDARLEVSQAFPAAVVHEQYALSQPRIAPHSYQAQRNLASIRDAYEYPWDVALQQRIDAAQHPDHLASVLLSSAEFLSAAHVMRIWRKLQDLAPNMTRATRPQLTNTLGILIPATMHFLPNLRPPEHATILIYLAHLQWLDANLVEGMLAHAAPRFSQYQEDDVVAVLSALARLRYPVDDDWMAAFLSHTTPHLATYSVDSSAQIIFCLARLSHNPSPRWLAAFFAHTHPLLSACHPQRLARVSWSLFLLGSTPPRAYTTAYATAALARLSDMPFEALADMLTALLSFSFQPSQPWLDSFCYHAHHHLVHAAPSHVARLMSAAACLDAQPSQTFLEAVRRHTQASIPRLSAHELISLTCAFASLGHRPHPSWTRAAVTHLLPSLASPQVGIGELAGLVLALERLGHDPGRRWLMAFEARALRQLPELSGEDRTSIMWSFATLGFRPNRRWINSFLHSNVSRPEVLCSAIEALASMERSPHRSWFCSFEAQVLRNISAFSAGQLASVLWCVAKLGHRPDTHWLTHVLAVMRGKREDMREQDVVAVVGALARWEHPPGQLWLRDVMKGGREGSEGEVEASGGWRVSAAALERLREPLKKLGMCLDEPVLQGCVEGGGEGGVAAAAAATAAVVDKGTCSRWVIVPRERQV